MQMTRRKIREQIALFQQNSRKHNKKKIKKIKKLMYVLVKFSSKKKILSDINIKA